MMAMMIQEKEKESLMSEPCSMYGHYCQSVCSECSDGNKFMIAIIGVIIIISVRQSLKLGIEGWSVKKKRLFQEWK